MGDRQIEQQKQVEANQLEGTTIAASMMTRRTPKQIFPIVLFVFQVILIILFGLYAEYDSDISMNTIYGSMCFLHCFQTRIKKSKLSN